MATPGVTARRNPRALLALVVGWIIVVFLIAAGVMPAATEAWRSTYWRNVAWLAFIPPAAVVGFRIGRDRGRRRG
jgi:hypothetical protein